MLQSEQVQLSSPGFPFGNMGIPNCTLTTEQNVFISGLNLKKKFKAKMFANTRNELQLVIVSYMDETLAFINE